MLLYNIINIIKFSFQRIQTMNIRIAKQKDLDIICRHDKHISKEELKYSISRDRIYFSKVDGEFIGWLRHSLFWDNMPFMNMLFILDKHRGKGYGKLLVEYWENKMREQNYKFVMTSTSSDEYAQHFYVKLGYHTIGGFTLPNNPYEIILIKEI